MDDVIFRSLFRWRYLKFELGVSTCAQQERRGARVEGLASLLDCRAFCTSSERRGSHGGDQAAAVYAH